MDAMTVNMTNVLEQPIKVVDCSDEGDGGGGYSRAT
jgi:hypothetical protein